MKHVDAVDVAADDARSKPVVSYSWMADGEPERCRVEGRDYAGEECYHCRRPVEGCGVRLRADDGDEYDLHAECARGLRRPRRGGDRHRPLFPPRPARMEGGPDA